MRIDATRTAYAVYSGAEQPPLGAHSVCFVPPRTQAHAVTRDSRNRARRKRKVRSPHQREEDRYNLYLKLGDYRSASRTPDTFTRGPSPSNTTNNHFQLGFMNQDADPVSSSTYWTPGPCTRSLSFSLLASLAFVFATIFLVCGDNYPKGLVLG